MKLLLFGIGLLFYSTSAGALTMPAEQVFKHLDEVQEVHQDYTFSPLGATITPATFSLFSHSVLALQPLLMPAGKLCLAFQGGACKSGHQQQQFCATMKTLYHYLDADINQFLHWLDAHGYTDSANVIIEADQQACIDQANVLMKILFLGVDQKEQREVLFAVANRFFEFCFEEKTFPNFKVLFYDKREQKLVKFLYSVMWLQLAGSGWRCWHESCLADLKKAADDGKRIVYLAGGSDIAMLLRRGIYNITVIDPQLPTQPKYYASNWDFLIASDVADGGIGDRIVFDGSDKRGLVMVRTAVEKSGYEFSLPLSSGEKVTLQHSTTTWSIRDSNNKELGTYILERRPLVQEDFASRADSVFLMSLNELHFISKPPLLGGWGMTPSAFDADCQIYIKQLRRPVTKPMIHNMRVSYLLNHALLHFLELGTCVN